MIGFLAALALGAATPAASNPVSGYGEGWRPNATERPAAQICQLIRVAATRHGLPPEFFARLIWKESRFDVKALSPKGAQGVAQFMPQTARIRGLDDPYDPQLALPASAAYLAELRARFGNLGLAAAAYNSGEDRVEGWLNGQSGLPGETLEYVHSITFRPAKWFREPNREVEPRPLVKGMAFGPACRQLPVMKTRSILYAGAEWQPWGVQIGGNWRQSVALRQFHRAQRRFVHILGDSAPMLIRSRAGLGRKRIWTVQVGAPSRRAANRICARLRAAGGACLVRRN